MKLTEIARVLRSAQNDNSFRLAARRGRGKPRPCTNHALSGVMQAGGDAVDSRAQRVVQRFGVDACALAPQ
jgi:hypothetical protein